MKREKFISHSIIIACLSRQNEMALTSEPSKEYPLLLQPRHERCYRIAAQQQMPPRLFFVVQLEIETFFFDS